MKNKKKSLILMWMGCLLIVFALVLTIYNCYEDKRAEKEANSVLTQIKKVMPIKDDESNSSIIINKNGYIGIISIPALNIELPVHDEWSYDNLKTAPCLYSGRIGEAGCVLAAHNYSSHFGKIKNLSKGDELIITTISGFEIKYAIDKIETLESNDIEKMKKSEWDLTIFTCTLDGRQRVTVRCKRFNG